MCLLLIHPRSLVLLAILILGIRIGIIFVIQEFYLPWLKQIKLCEERQQKLRLFREENALMSWAQRKLGPLEWLVSYKENIFDICEKSKASRRVAVIPYLENLFLSVRGCEFFFLCICFGIALIIGGFLIVNLIIQSKRRDRRDAETTAEIERLSDDLRRCQEDASKFKKEIMKAMENKREEVKKLSIELYCALNQNESLENALQESNIRIEALTQEKKLLQEDITREKKEAKNIVAELQCKLYLKEEEVKKKSLLLNGEIETRTNLEQEMEKIRKFIEERKIEDKILGLRDELCQKCEEVEMKSLLYDEEKEKRKKIEQKLETFKKVIEEQQRVPELGEKNLGLENELRLKNEEVERKNLLPNEEIKRLTNLEPKIETFKKVAEDQQRVPEQKNMNQMTEIVKVNWKKMKAKDTHQHNKGSRSTVNKNKGDSFENHPISSRLSNITECGQTKTDASRECKDVVVCGCQCSQQLTERVTSLETAISKIKREDLDNKPVLNHDLVKTEFYDKKIQRMEDITLGLEKQMKSNDEKLKEQKELVNDLGEKVEFYHKRVEEIMSFIIYLQKKIDHFDKRVEERMEYMLDLEKRIESYDKKVEERMEFMLDLENRIQCYDKKVKKRAEFLLGLEKKIESYDKKVEERTEWMLGLEKRIPSYDKKAKKRAEFMLDLEKKIESYDRKVEERMKFLLDLLKMIDCFDKRVEERTECMLGLEKRIQSYDKKDGRTAKVKRNATYKDIVISFCNPDEISRNIKVIRLLGKGGNGKAEYVLFRGEFCVLKTSFWGRIPLQELQIMVHLNGAGGAPKLIAATRHSFLCTYVGDKTFLDLIRDTHCNQSFLIHCLIMIAKQVRELHSHNISHNDLKSDNIMLDSNTNKFSIIDFGLSTEMGECLNIRDKSRLKWMAPEVRRRERVCPASDVYSLGILLGKVIHSFYTPNYVAEIVVGKATMDDHKMRLSLNEFIWMLEDSLKYMTSENEFFVNRGREKTLLPKL